MSKIPTLIEGSRSSVTNAPTLVMGWALKSTHPRRSKFSDKQKQYLNAKFQIGERTGKKADPTDVCKAMRTAKDSNGERLFGCEDFLTSQQICSYFSRQRAPSHLRCLSFAFGRPNFGTRSPHGRLTNDSLTFVTVTFVQIWFPFSAL